MIVKFKRQFIAILAITPCPDRQAHDLDDSHPLLTVVWVGSRPLLVSDIRDLLDQLTIGGNVVFAWSRHSQ